MKDLEKKTVEDYLLREKKGIEKYIDDDDLEQTLSEICRLSHIMFCYNQFYTDDDLESYVERIKQKIGLKVQYDAIKKKILLFNGFPSDARALTQVYIRGFIKNGYSLVYVTDINAKGKMPILSNELAQGDCKIYYVPKRPLLDRYKELCRIIQEERPEKGFLHIYNADVAGVLAFQTCEGVLERYQLDHTDHGFWLGRHCFDYCIEGRDYGAAISENYRKIAKDKIIKLRNYPIINEKGQFKGFPFEKRPQDVVIFSGGSLYKTMDSAGTYYKLIEEILRKYSEVIFWYAGQGDARKLHQLMEKYPERVYFTPERNDLYEVLRHCDLYINTYPIGGGLMPRYCAVSGIVPLALTSAPCSSMNNGFFSNVEGMILTAKDIAEMVKLVDLYIHNTEYRKETAEKLRDRVVKEWEFQENLLMLLQEHRTQYSVESIPCVHEWVKKDHEYFWDQFKIDATGLYDYNKIFGNT